LLFSAEHWLSPSDGSGFPLEVARSCAQPTPAPTNSRFRGRIYPHGVNCMQVGHRPLSTRVLGENDNGRWLAVRVGPIAIIAACLPPLAEHPELSLRQCHDFVTFRDNILSTHQGQYFVVGDFNTRMGALSRDAYQCCDRPRREWMREWFEDPEWLRQEPDAGRWTTHAPNGRGITDFLFTPIRIFFSRTNICRLTQRRLPYEDAFFAGLPAVRAELEELLDIIEDQARNNVQYSAADRTQVADYAEDIVRTWLHHSASTAAGILHFRGHSPHRYFQNDTLLALLDEVQKAHDEYVALPPGPERQAAWNRRTTANKIYCAAVQRRRTRKYRTDMDALIHEGPGTFMKMISCVQARASRSHCALDPEQLDTYADQFRTTFGAEPTGTSSHLVPEDFLAQTDPTRDRPFLPHDPPWLTKIAV
ncbi:hypothetical protein HDU96_004062, partial [Phlyctochytrium bullatum]